MFKAVKNFHSYNNSKLKQHFFYTLTNIEFGNTSIQLAQLKETIFDFVAVP